MTQHYPKPIAPPPEVTGEWWIEWDSLDESERPRLEDFIATRAAKWGADQELEACIDWISVWHGLEHPELLIELLRARRRPKPPSLKEQAFAILTGAAVYELHGGATTDNRLSVEDMSIIRRALESINE